MSRLGARAVPTGFPRYGYLLEAENALVGAILLIFSRARATDGDRVRCSVSSWFVQPSHRGYASLLVSKALGRQDVTYLNVTPAPHTLSIIQAQGYSQFSNGVFAAFPALQLDSIRARVTAVDGNPASGAELDEHEMELLRDHARYGCISLVGHAGAAAYPFVFRPRSHKGIACAQLVYCRAVSDFIRTAGPVGRFLALRGRALVVIDANEPIPGLVGKYFPGRMVKYFKGPHRPRLGDLAYTETAMFGM
jgi:hypothetical protein